MPYLCKDAAASCVNGLCYWLPSFNLLLRPDAWHTRISHTKRIYRRTLADNQSGTRTLAVVLHHHRRRQMIGSATQSRQRRHKDAIRKLKITNTDRVE